MRKTACSNPSRNRPKSLKQVVTAPLSNARQQLWVSGVLGEKVCTARKLLGFTNGIIFIVFAIAQKNVHGMSLCTTVFVLLSVSLYIPLLPPGGKLYTRDRVCVIANLRELSGNKNVQIHVCATYLQLSATWYNYTYMRNYYGQSDLSMDVDRVTDWPLRGYPQPRL